MKYLVHTGAASLLLAFAGAALSQVAAPPTGADSNRTGTKFGTVDINGDGRVSKSEAQAHAELVSQFATLDANSDSYLSLTEFGKWKGSAPADVSPAPGATAPRESSPQPGSSSAPPFASPPSGSPQSTTEPPSPAPAAQ
jgi:hypothetical protein